MTNRPSGHAPGKGVEKGRIAGFSRYKVCDSFSYSASSSSPSPSGEGEEGDRRISRKQLTELEMRLGERDRQVLLALQRHRYLMSSQVQRLVFTDASSSSAGLRAASRCLKKLREMGLIDSLARRIGGVRAGSGSLVCYLTHAGERLLRLHDRTAAPCRRFFEPSPYFLSHTLAVAEVSIQLQEICGKEKMELPSIQLEPECWRAYSEHGTQVALKPDLYAVTVSGEFEDRWFFEVDLDTESPAKIIEKCQKYHRYYRSGLEQKESGVFPLTVWIVPGETRKQHLLAHIRAAFEKQPRLFAVITDSELEHLIRQGGDEAMLC